MIKEELIKKMKHKTDRYEAQSRQTQSMKQTDMKHRADRHEA